MKIKVVRRRRRRLEYGNRLSPVVAVGLADGEAVQRGKTGVGRRRDQRLAGDIAFVARELRPEGRLEIDIFAHGYGAEIGQGRETLCRRRLKRFQRFRAHKKTEVMLAQAEIARRQIVLGRHQAGA